MSRPSPKRAAITGATGFLGSHLVTHLLDQGYTITCITRPTSDTRWIADSPVDIVPHKLLGDNEALAKTLDGHDVVFHVAGAVRALTYDDFLRTNAEATQRLIEACIAAPHPPRRLVLVSSVAACGPAPEGQRIDGALSPSPITDYGRSKLEGERRALRFKDRIEVIIVRPAAIYGPRDRELLSVFSAARRGVMPAPAGRRQVVNMAYVTDIAEGVRLAGEAPVPSGSIYPLGAAQELTLDDLAETFGTLFSRRVRVLQIPRAFLYLVALAGEVWARLRRRPAMLNRQKIPELRASWRLDLSAARRALGYTPRVALPEGAEKTLAWYRREGLLSYPSS